MSTVTTSPATGKKFLGFPLEGFGLFTSALLTLASGFITFFAATTLAIFGFLIWNLATGVKPDYAKTYLYVGFPAGVIVFVIAAIVFGTLWLRATFSKK